MPYRNIVFVKFRLELLSDIRFTDHLNDKEKLLFMGLLLLAGITRNNIPNDPVFIKRHLNLEMEVGDIETAISVIKSNFQGLLSVNKMGKFDTFNKFSMGTPNTLKFKNFNKIHNWLGNSEGNTKESQDKIRKEEDKIRKDKIVKTFIERHKEVTGVSYPLNYGKDQKIIYDLLEVYDTDTLNTLIIEFFNGAKDKSEWWFDKQLSVGMFKSCIPQIINRIRKK